jgi:hypothetical protein
MTDSSDESPQEEPQQVRSSHIGALVPTHIGRGVFSTGVAVLQGQYEFIVDFLLQMQQPQQVVARVVLPPPVVGQFLHALGENITKYENRFGPIAHNQPAANPVPTEGQQDGATQQPETSVPPVEGTTGSMPQHRAEDLYDQLRLPDDVMAGHYANAVMIGHSTSEFSFDFIATFYPRSVVVQRVFLSAPNVPRLKDSLSQAFEQFRKRVGNQRPPGGEPRNN